MKRLAFSFLLALSITLWISEAWGATGVAQLEDFTITLNGVEAARVTTAGKIGIGTTVPGGQLDVINSAAGQYGLRIRAAPSQSASLVRFEDSTGTALSGITVSGRYMAPSGAAAAPGYTFLSDTSSGMYLPSNSTLALSTGSTERLRIDSSGKVGIGTTAPVATLDVNGYARLAKQASQPAACAASNDGAIALTSQYTLCVCKGGATSWVLASDGTTACTW